MPRVRLTIAGVDDDFTMHCDRYYEKGSFFWFEDTTTRKGFQTKDIREITITGEEPKA